MPITPVQQKELAYNYETSTLQDRRKVPEDSIGASIEARGGAGRSLRAPTDTKQPENFIQSSHKKIKKPAFPNNHMKTVPTKISALLGNTQKIDLSSHLSLAKQRLNTRYLTCEGEEEENVEVKENQEDSILLYLRK